MRRTFTVDSFTLRTFRELKDYVVSMKSDKDEAPKEGEADVAKVTVLDAKNFDDSIKTGKSGIILTSVSRDIQDFWVRFETIIFDKINFRCNIR